MRVTLAGLALALTALFLDLQLLRSFEFFGVPAALPAYAPPPWDRLESARPAFAATAGTPTARSALLVIVDGMRLDASRRLPTYERLRSRGADAVCEVDFPTFSRVGYAALLTGAHPLVHGYLANANLRPSPVPTLMDTARASGLRTRLFHEGRSGISRTFGASFDEDVELDEAGWARLASGTARRMDVVYLPEPDLTAHKHGGASEAYLGETRVVDAKVARIAASVDLSRDLLVVATDHGHIDRGGHGGPEEAVRFVPVVLAGPGADADRLLRLREVPSRIARALGIAEPPAAVRRPPGDALPARLTRLLFASLAILVVALLLPGARASDLLSAAGGVALFALLFAMRGFPFSFSIANSPSELPRLVAEVLGMAALGVTAGAGVARSQAAYVTASLRLGAIALAVSLAVAGPTARTAAFHPHASFIAHLAASHVIATGLLAALLQRVGRERAV